MSLKDRLQHGWNAFMNKDPTLEYSIGPVTSFRPDRRRTVRGNEKSIINSIFNRMAVDASQIDIRHVRLDKNDRYIEDMDSELNQCLKYSANIDQSGRAFMQDVVMSMFDEGHVVIVPVETDDKDPNKENSYDITQLRTGKVIQWSPRKVKIKVYSEWTGQFEEVWMNKEAVAIVENPFYSTMNEPSSTMQRLIRKLNLSDIIDEQSSSGKLDLIIQLPYVLKTDAQREQATRRRQQIIDQLNDSNYGIAYTDGTEHITQLNRSVENTLPKQIEYYTNMLYSQLGLTIEIMNGTADEQAMNNYYSRTIEPIINAITEEMARKFLTRTARTRKQAIMSFRDPFKLIPVSQVAEMADKLGRNEIVTSNEMRQVIGMKPSEDPRADELRNKNLSEAKGEEHVNVDGQNITDKYFDEDDTKK